VYFARATLHTPQTKTPSLGLASPSAAAAFASRRIAAGSGALIPAPDACAI
jgi:hypothetical protein